MTAREKSIAPYSILALFALSLVILFVAFVVHMLAGSDLVPSGGPEATVELIMAFANFAWIGLIVLGLRLERRGLVCTGYVAFAANFFFWIVMVMAIL